MKRLRGQPAFERINTLVFETIPHGDAYRVRIGDYRIGVIFDGETVTFKRALHRKDIYRYFP